MRAKGVAALALVLATAGMRPGHVHAQATIGGEWRSDIAAYAERIVSAGLAPGLGIAVSVGDRVVYAAGFGVADAATGRRITGDTPFYIASSTKSLTALAAILAAERGELDLRAPMIRYLPDAELADGVARESITVHDLLALTHGLNGGGPVVMRTAYTGEFTREQLLELLRHHQPTGNYGKFEYNNLGYNLLGMVLESVYRESWKDVVHRLVLEPLGMSNTFAYLSRYATDQVAMPHEETPDGLARMPLGKDDSNMHAAGGHFASARDLARYLAAHASGGMLEGRRVLPEAPIRRTHMLQVTQNRTFGPYRRHGWGYGWDLGTYESDTLIHRFGGFSGYRSHMSFIPAHAIGVVVLVNGDGTASAASDVLATYIYDRLLARPDRAERGAARLAELTAQAERARKALADHLAERAARLQPLRHRLEEFAGAYESPLLGRMEWTVIAEGLEMTLGVMRGRAEVFDATKDQLRIELAGSGQVATFVFPEGGGPARAVRVGGTEFVRVDR